MEDEKAPNAAFRTIVQTVKTYRNPLYSLYQSAVKETLLEEKVSIDDIEHHEMMRQTIHFLNCLESRDESTNDKSLQLQVTFATSFHTETKNPAAAVYHNTLLTVFNETSQNESKTDDGDVPPTTTLNLLQYDTKDVRWAKCAVLLPKYWFEWKANDLHYNKYTDIDDFQFSIPDSFHHKGKYLRIGLLGDWGGGNRLALQTINGLMQFEPDIIIHLGDVYYSGTDKEFNKHYVEILNKARKRHKCPVFSVPGNHDYYAGGKPFYEAVKTVNKDEYVPQWFIDKKHGQTSSFWGLSNSKFYVCGLDTGYDAGNAAKEAICSGVLEFAAHYPTLHDSEGEYHITHFKEAIKDGKSIIINSHHPLFSAFEPIGAQVSKKIYINDKLQKLFKDYLSSFQFWFWGHEHNFAVYYEHLGLKRGRLVGHGCIPEVKKGEVTPYDIKDEDIPVNTDVKVTTSTFKQHTIFNNGFGYVDLNVDGSSDAYYYEIKQTDEKTPFLTHKESAPAYVKSSLL